MTILRALLSRVSGLFGRRYRDVQLNDEIQTHLDLLAEEHVGRGMVPAEARAAARREFGGVDQIKETYRDQRGLPWVDSLARDVRYGLRSLRKNRGFTTVAVLTLALGIGANTAIFTLIDALMFRWLPVRNPQQLVQVTKTQGGASRGENFSYPQVRAFAQETDVFAGLFGFDTAVFTVGPADALERARGAWVTGAYYDTLGLQPAAGRLLSPQDDRREAPPAAVIADQYWDRKFARDPQAIGRTLIVDTVPVTIVGVTPPGFTGMDVSDVADITLAVSARPQFPPRQTIFLEPGATWLRTFARLRTGMARAQAKARLGVVWSRLASAPAAPGRPAIVGRRLAAFTLDLIDGGTGWTGLRGQFRQPLFVLMGSVGLILLIACANVANLLLAQATARRREMAVRLALGAGRGRIIRQLLTESALLSTFGVAVGLVFAWWGGRVLVDLLSSGQEAAILIDLRPNGHVLAFASLVALCTTLLSGVAPAYRATKMEASSALGDASTRITGARGRLAPILVSAQVALSLILLIGAGLFLRTLHNLRTLDAGFRHEGVLIAPVDGPRAGYGRPALNGFYQDLLRRVEGLAGVKSVSFSSVAPPSGGGGISQAPRVNGRPTGPDEIHFNAVSPRYFETMRTPIVRGRDFSSGDSTTAQRVVIVNEAFANRYFEGAPPLGQHVSLDGPGGTQVDMEVVGVVKDAVYETLRQGAPPAFYAPFAQRGGGAVTFEVNVAGSLAAVAPAVRREFQARLPGMLVEVRTLTSQVERTLVEERLMATLASAFGVLALVLASIGLYGLLTCTVARRTSEIGLRMALGAQRWQVLWLVMRDAVRMLALGAAFGFPAAWAASRVISSMLFGLQGTDPFTIVGATAVLMAAGALAGFLPARRAAHVDPMVALRHE